MSFRSVLQSNINYLCSVSNLVLVNSSNKSVLEFVFTLSKAHS